MKTIDMMYIALLAAVTAALGLLPPLYVPFAGITVPITAQTFGVMLAGALLGARRGGASILLFVILVAVGAPILSGGRGGFHIFLTASGGYILAWPIAAFVIGLIVERYWETLKLWKVLLANILGGIILIYLSGITYMAFLTGAPWVETAIANLVFVPGDLIKAGLAAYIAIEIRKRKPLINPKRSHLSSVDHSKVA